MSATRQVVTGVVISTVLVAATTSSIMTQQISQAKKDAASAIPRAESQERLVEGQLAKAEARLAEAIRDKKKADAAAKQDLAAVADVEADLQSQLEAAHGTITVLQDRLTRLMRRPSDFRVVCDDGLTVNDLVDPGNSDPCTSWQVDY